MRVVWHLVNNHRIERAMKKIFTVIFLSLLLQGCIASAFVAGGAAGTGVGADNRTFETLADDNNMSYQASQRIAANPTLVAQTHIVTAAYNRVLLLAGQAPTPELRDQVVQLAKGVPNVRRIFNEITLDQPTSAMRRSKDAAITTNVRARMLTTTNLKSTRFKIVTENGTVFIMGLSSRKQADIAAAVARNSTGVQRVVKLVEYVTPDESDAS